MQNKNIRLRRAPEAATCATSPQAVRSHRTGKPARDIVVDLYHQTVLCAFRVEDKTAVTNSEQANRRRLDEWVDAIESWPDRAGASRRIWRTVTLFPDDESHVPETSFLAAARQLLRYAEFAFFHPFVRRFLYGGGPGGERNRAPTKASAANAAMRVLRRDDVRWALVTVEVEVINKSDDSRRLVDRAYLLRVRRFELYLFESQTGFLVIEFDNRLKAVKDESGNWVVRDRLGESHGVDSENRNWDVALGAQSQWSVVPKDLGRVVLTDNYTLEDVIRLQDALRRLYVPYWDLDPLRIEQPGKLALSPGHSIKLLEWYDDKGERWADYSAESTAPETDGTSGPGDSDAGAQPEQPPEGADLRLGPYEPEKAIAGTKVLREPPLLSWWRDALLPFRHERDRTTRPRADGGRAAAEPAAQSLPSTPCFTSLGDDRMGVMTYAAVNDPRQISDADWMRLATQDGRGTNDVFPASPQFYGVDSGEAIGAFQRDFCYDRHFSSSPEPPADESSHTTRYLCSGMGFVGVGSSKADSQTIAGRGPTPRRAFALDPVSGLLGYFRYHYFKLGLIVHFHRATLLTLEDRLAESVKEFQGFARDLRSDEGQRRLKAFRDSVQNLKFEFLKFRCSYWFTEVSGQVQGQELFDLWSRKLRTRELFEEVNSELNEAEEFLRIEQQEIESGEAKKLTLLAGWFAPIAIIVPVLATCLTSSRSPWLTLSFILASLSICVAVITAIFGSPWAWLKGNDLDSSPGRWKWKGAVVVACLSIAALLFGCTTVLYVFLYQREETPPPRDRSLPPDASKNASLPAVHARPAAHEPGPAPVGAGVVKTAPARSDAPASAAKGGLQPQSSTHGQPPNGTANAKAPRIPDAKDTNQQKQPSDGAWNSKAPSVPDAKVQPAPGGSVKQDSKKASTSPADRREPQ
jgi:hypothetical protein